ncbi:hypothetical protein ANO11243_088040 [Dothideomycetidae sp. 11243]|nr:hypothetical protein ANO11243_088040 [fungal sp. No.11243]
MARRATSPIHDLVSYELLPSPAKRVRYGAKTGIALPLELVEIVLSYLSREDAKSLRRVSKDVERKVSPAFFQSVVVPFNSELQEMVQRDVRSWDDAKRGPGKERATRIRVERAQPSASLPWLSDNPDTEDIYRGYGYKVFSGFGPHIRNFGMSFEVTEDDLCRTPDKQLLDDHLSYYGEYQWPPPCYRRFSQLESLEVTADENSLLRDAMAHLTRVKAIGLCLNNGLGWMSGERTPSHQYLSRHPPIFGNKFEACAPGNPSAPSAENDDDDDVRPSLGDESSSRRTTLTAAHFIRTHLSGENRVRRQTAGQILDRTRLAKRAIADYICLIYRSRSGPLLQEIFRAFSELRSESPMSLQESNLERNMLSPEMRARLQSSLLRVRRLLCGENDHLPQPSAPSSGSQHQTVSLHGLHYGGHFMDQMILQEPAIDAWASDTEEEETPIPDFRLWLRWARHDANRSLAMSLTDAAAVASEAAAETAAATSKTRVHPTRLSQTQKEWLLEADWAQRAFLQSYVLSVVDNASIFANVSFVNLACIPSRYIPLLSRKDLWDALPALEHLVLHVLPEWRHMRRCDNHIDEIATSPSEACDLVFHLLNIYISPLDTVKKLEVGWARTAEDDSATGKLTNYLPAPIRKLEPSPHSRRIHTVHLPHVRQLTLANCYLDAQSLKAMVRRLQDCSLRTVALQRVSLLAQTTAVLASSSNDDQQYREDSWAVVINDIGPREVVAGLESIDSKTARPRKLETMEFKDCAYVLSKAWVGAEGAFEQAHRGHILPQLRAIVPQNVPDMQAEADQMIREQELAARASGIEAMASVDEYLGVLVTDLYSTESRSLSSDFGFETKVNGAHSLGIDQTHCKWVPSDQARFSGMLRQEH